MISIILWRTSLHIKKWLLSIISYHSTVKTYVAPGELPATSLKFLVITYYKNQVTTIKPYGHLVQLLFVPKINIQYLRKTKFSQSKKARSLVIMDQLVSCQFTGEDRTMRTRTILTCRDDILSCPPPHTPHRKHQPCHLKRK